MGLGYNMTMRIKILLLLCILTVLFTVWIYLSGVYESRELDKFLTTFRIEKEIGFAKSIESYGNSLSTYAFDYTYWDEMLNFVTTRNKKWAYENIETTLGTFNAHYVWIYQTDFSLVYSVNAPEFPKLKDLPFTKDELQKIVTEKKFNHFFIQVDSQICEICSAPIQPSEDIERLSEPKGYFFTGRLWTKKVLDDLSSMTVSNINLLPAEMEPVIKQPEKAAKYNIILSKMLYTWDNKPIAQIVSNSEQPFLQESVKFSKVQIWKSIIFIFFILLVITLFLIRSVDKPIRLISTCLEESNPQVLERLKVETTEFGYIAVLIDQFFQQREELKQEVEERTKAEQRARDIIDKSPIGMHFYELKSENRLIFSGANLAADFILGVDNQRFIGKTIEEVFPNLVKTCIPDAFRKAAATGERFDTDQLNFEADDIHGIFEVHTFQIAPNSIATFFCNISLHKQAEEAMRASEVKITKS